MWILISTAFAQTISASAVRLREAPDTSSTYIALPYGTPVKPTGKSQGDWVEIAVGDRTGWVTSVHTRPMASSERTRRVGLAKQIDASHRRELQLCAVCDDMCEAEPGSDEEHLGRSQFECIGDAAIRSWMEPAITKLTSAQRFVLWAAMLDEKSPYARTPNDILAASPVFGAIPVVTLDADPPFHAPPPLTPGATPWEGEAAAVVRVDAVDAGLAVVETMVFEDVGELGDHQFGQILASGPQPVAGTLVDRRWQVERTATLVHLDAKYTGRPSGGWGIDAGRYAEMGGIGSLRSAKVTVSYDPKTDAVQVRSEPPAAPGDLLVFGPTPRDGVAKWVMSAEAELAGPGSRVTALDLDTDGDGLIDLSLRHRQFIGDGDGAWVETGAVVLPAGPASTLLGHYLWSD